MNKFYSIYDNYDFIVKEGKNWNLYATVASMTLWIAYIAMTFIFLIITYFYFQDNPNNEDIIIFLLFIVIFARYWIHMLSLELKLKKAKNLKYDWMWIVKRLKIAEITKARVDRNKGGSFDVICVKANDWAISYYSTGHLKWEISGVSQSDLREIYKYHWFIYDEKQSQKKDLLSYFDWEISKTEYEMQNSWFFKRIKLEKNLQKLIKERQTIETWYIPQYWEVNGNRISVWDNVDVYIDSNNPNIYLVDIDFLFDK